VFTEALTHTAFRSRLQSRRCASVFRTLSARTRSHTRLVLMPVEAELLQRRGRNRHMMASPCRHHTSTSDISVSLCELSDPRRCSGSQSVLPSMSAFPMSIHRLHVLLLTRCLSKLDGREALRHAGQAYTETRSAFRLRGVIAGCTQPRFRARVFVVARSCSSAHTYRSIFLA
jgi:hypothetical protein